MLKFIDENDFLLVDTFKENEDGSVSWVWDEGEGLPTHSGVIREGFTRTTQVQDGTESVQVGTEQVQIGTETVVVGQNPVLDENGESVIAEDTDEPLMQDITEEQPVYEEQPVFEEQPKMVDVEIDVWAKLHELEASGEIAIEYPTQEDLDAREYEKQVQAFKADRQRLLDTAIVTTTSGLQFDADEKSISRMANAILAAQLVNVTTLEWSLADTNTGVMTEVSLSELQEAHTLAVQNMADIWGME